MTTKTNNDVTDSPLIAPFQLKYSLTGALLKNTSDSEYGIVRALVKIRNIVGAIFTGIAETFLNLSKVILNVGIAPINFIHGLVRDDLEDEKELEPLLNWDVVVTKKEESPIQDIKEVKDSKATAAQQETIPADNSSGKIEKIKDETPPKQRLLKRRALPPKHSYTKTIGKTLGALVVISGLGFASYYYNQNLTSLANNAINIIKDLKKNIG